MDAEHESDLQILGVDHVGVAVADLDEAVAFYRDVLGLGPFTARRIPGRTWSR